MSGVLRDIVARFSVQVDDKPLTKLEKSLKRARESVNTMGTYVASGFVAAAGAAYYFTEAASRAEETLNVINQTFGKNSDAVVAWSKTLAKEVGRSEYTLQSAASEFGAFLSPKFEDKNVVTKMSEDLSKLGVDLASFYNTSDSEAQMRLMSGLSGETEAVRKLGVDISDEALKALYNSDESSVKKGGQYKALSIADKTLLRFQKILKDTQEKQGDVQRTAQGWANSMKRVTERWKTFSVTLGKLTQKVMLPLLHKFEKYTPTLESLILNSSALDSGLKLLAVSGGVLLAAFVALNFPAVVLATTLGAVVLAFEDVLTLLDGGQSIIGDFIKELTGTNDPLDKLGDWTNDFIGVIDILTGTLYDLAENIAGVVTGSALLNGFTTEHGDAATARATQRYRTKNDLEASQREQRIAAAAKGDQGAWEATFAGHTKPDNMQAAFKADFLQGFTSGQVTDVGTMDRAVASGFVSQSFSNQWRNEMEAPSWAQGGSAAGGAPGAVTIQNNVTVTGIGKDAVKAGLDEANRAALARVSEEKGKKQ
ncbi:MAG: hypothetical protein RLZZ450_84 [Pseudomonadota bacterium]|jgi:hypothetical protein